MFIPLAKELQNIIYVLLLALIIGHQIKAFADTGVQPKSYITVAITTVLVLIIQHFLDIVLGKIEQLQNTGKND